MDTFQDVWRSNAARHHVDNVSFRQHGTDRANFFWIVRLHRKATDFVLRDPQITRDVFQKLPGSRRTLRGHFIVRNLALLVRDHGAAMQGTAIHNRHCGGVQEPCTTGMAGH